jgi:hypothetical protein
MAAADNLKNTLRSSKGGEAGAGAGFLPLVVSISCTLYVLDAMPQGFLRLNLLYLDVISHALSRQDDF